MRRSFFFQHLLQFIVPVMIPVLLLGILSGYIMNQKVKEEIDLRNYERIRSNAMKLDSVFNELNQINLNLSYNPAITVRLKSVLRRSMDGISAEDYVTVNAIIDLLYGATHYNKNIASIYVYFNNPNGRFISSTHRFSSLDFFSDTEWYESYLEHLEQDALMWSEFRTIKPYNYENTTIPVLTIYHKIFSSAKDEADGVLVLNIQTDRINQILSSMLLDDREIIVVVDSEDRPLFQSSPILDFTPLDVHLAANADTQYRIYECSSEMQLWSYYLLLPESDVYAVPNLLTRATIFLIFATLLIGIVISSFLANRNYKEIQNIVKTIELAKKGEKLPQINTIQPSVYGFIIQNIIASFLRTEYLKVQLSEKHYHMQALHLLALQSQLNPHFLFNTIETIYWRTFSLTGKPNEATMMIENLSDILRYALNSEERLVPLQEEIDITNAYIKIQHVRYKDSFDLCWNIQCPTDEVLVLRLILQPIIENAIYHGVRGINQKATITIHISKKSNLLRIAIIDNGRGMSEEQLKLVRENLNNPPVGKGSLIGLANTSKRLQLQYGNKYKLKIYSRQNKGTCIIMRLLQETT